ncbi:hypothetical protein BDV95DRAFT_623164 [Massariosphaeria phaeospora]|uniref:Uncharacterized protein n=1 Tax=Massariosphaeria phaeospora TaxID=100035 RepID=A0A7C8M566_9PLEO|nr:hypothetical protein BDV95DRAFT_623164 [Massariosphaeria phaeospora]
METWKSINLSTISPLLALSLSTSQWNLEALPGNLLATNVSLHDVQAHNTSLLPVWAFPDGCKTTDLDISYPSTHNYTTVINTTHTPFCPALRRCSDNSTQQPACLSLLTGTGKRTTGPLHTPTVALAHILSTLVTLLSLLAMGCSKSKLDAADLDAPPRANGLASSDLRSTYNPPNPPPSKSKHHPPVPAPAPLPAAKAKEIAHCTELLRQMYGLELLVWAATDNVSADEREKAELARQREKADALFGEVSRIVAVWCGSGVARGYFNEAERRYVREIGEAVERYGRGR